MSPIWLSSTGWSGAPLLPDKAYDLVEMVHQWLGRVSVRPDHQAGCPLLEGEALKVSILLECWILWHSWLSYICLSLPFKVSIFSLELWHIGSPFVQSQLFCSNPKLLIWLWYLTGMHSISDSIFHPHHRLWINDCYEMLHSIDFYT